jgi:imidazolonepropionase-like amidohydrolase
MLSIKASTIYTGKDIIKDGVIHVKDKEIIDISTTNQLDVKDEYEVITPAFIDPHCHIGMCRAGEPSNEGETNEKMDSIVTLADALDSVQMDDVSFQESIESGVLYSCVVPGSGNLLGGKSAVIRNYGRTSTDAFISRAGIKVAVGYNPTSTHEWKGKRSFTRMGSLALLREKLYSVKSKIEAQENNGKNKEDSFTREDEILKDILCGDELLRVHVHKTDDIEAILRLIDEFNEADSSFKMNLTIEHASDVHAIDIFNKLKERNIRVVYGPLDSFAYKVELKHENWKNIKHLLDSNVEYGLMTDHPVILQKMLLFQLRWFIRLGLNKQQAIQIITHNNAKILGLDNILGTLKKGKWASFVCWNGDPFDMTSYPVAVYGEGEELYPLWARAKRCPP